VTWVAGERIKYGTSPPPFAKCLHGPLEFTHINESLAQLWGWWGAGTGIPRGGRGFKEAYEDMCTCECSWGEAWEGREETRHTVWSSGLSCNNWLLMILPFPLSVFGLCFYFVGKNDVFFTNWFIFPTIFNTSTFVSFLCLFLRAPARTGTLGAFWYFWCRFSLDHYYEKIYFASPTIGKRSNIPRSGNPHQIQYVCVTCLQVIIIMDQQYIVGTFISSDWLVARTRTTTPEKERQRRTDREKETQK